MAQRPVTADRTPAFLRWVILLGAMATCGALGVLLVNAPGAPTPFLHSLSLAGVGVVALAWVVYPLAGGLLMTGLLVLCLVWAWGVRQAPEFWITLWTCAVLCNAALLQRRRQTRRFQHLEQLLQGVREEQGMKDQALAVARQTEEALRKKLGRYAQLQSIAEAFSNLTDLHAVAQLAVERAFTLIGKSQAGLLFLVDTQRQELSLFASKKSGSVSSIRAKHGDQFDRHVLRSQRPLLVNDVRRDFRFTVSTASERAIGSVIACPLIVGQSPEGVLRLDSEKPGAYSQDDLRFLDILLDLVATAMTNAKLFARTQRLAVTDGLTGLMLRLPFVEALTRELTRASRTREPVSVLMIDVDRFKECNDTYGHLAGDLLLKTVAQALQTMVPPGGVVARYGGDEFALFLPRCSQQQASQLAERLRQAIRQGAHVPSQTGHADLRGNPWHSSAAPGAVAWSSPQPEPGGAPLPTREPAARHVRTGGAQPEPVTLSIGVATCPTDAQVELELIRVADQRLYQAKRSGRNLVCST